MPNCQFDFSRLLSSTAPVDHLMTLSEIAKHYNRSIRTIQRWTVAKVLPEPFRSPKGNIIGWRRTTIEAYDQYRSGQPSYNK